MRFIREKLIPIGWLLVVSSLIGAAIGVAPAAKADEMDYLQLLNARGHVVYDTAAAIQTGWAVCEQLNYSTGDVVALWLFSNTSWAMTPTVYDAAEIVLSAVEGLCPWHDHRGGDYAV